MEVAIAADDDRDRAGGEDTTDRAFNRRVGLVNPDRRCVDVSSVHNRQPLEGRHLETESTAGAVAETASGISRGPMRAPVR